MGTYVNYDTIPYATPSKFLWLWLCYKLVLYDDLECCDSYTMKIYVIAHIPNHVNKMNQYCFLPKLMFPLLKVLLNDRWMEETRFARPLFRQLIDNLDKIVLKGYLHIVKSYV